MQILLLSDIHGNFPALKAVAEHFPPEDFNYIINCGDSLVYAPFPNETLSWLRKNRAISILGNTDKKVLKLLKGKTFNKPGKEEKRIMYTSTAAELTKENSTYLKGFKKKTQLRLKPETVEKKKLTLGIYHGSPAAHHEFLFDTTPDSRFAELATNAKCKIIVSGHSHTPYHKTVSNIHFINPGSVGRMFDGNPTASCAILKISATAIEVEHYRIAYPVMNVVRRIRKQELPEIYCRMYISGRKLN